MRAPAGMPDNDPFKFCSPECYDSARKPPAQPQEFYLVQEDGRLTSICNDTVQPPPVRFFPCCAAISSEHEKLLHIYVRSKTGKGECKTEELALCFGHFSEFSAERLYVVYHMRSLPSQVVTEFFVSPDLSVVEALPYIPADEGIRQSLDALRNSGNVQSSLQKAIAFVSTHDSLSQCHTKLSEMICCGRIIVTNSES